MADDRSSLPPPPAVKSYGAGIEARMAARQEERRSNPVFPNLAQAAVTHQPGQGEQTLADIGRTQREDAERPDEPRQAQLSAATVEGLKALKAAADAQKPPEPPPAPTPKPQEKPDPDAELDDEDIALAEALRGVREDAIQNERERKAVATRVPEIDLAEGIVTGEFTQMVPIVPEKLNVRFRCLTAGENNELRLMLYEAVQKDPRKAQIGQDLLAFYQTVASVMSLNKTIYAKHIIREEPTGKMVFNKEAFEQKLEQFQSFPLPLIASLGTHGAWFEQRVRELFVTTDRLKNG